MVAARRLLVPGLGLVHERAQESRRIMMRQRRKLIGAEELIHHFQHRPEHTVRKLLRGEVGVPGLLDDRAGGRAVTADQGLEQTFDDDFLVHLK